MYNEKAYALGANRSCIRELFEYGKMRAAIVGAENIFDFSLGNPSIPTPAEVNETVKALLEDTDSLALHGYTSATGDVATRKAIADDLNARYNTSISPDSLFICGGAAPELVAGHIDAALIHEAAIGKIAGEQILKLCTLGLTEEEAEQKIIDGFLKN